MNKGYCVFDHISREVLDAVMVGDLIKVNDWTKPMKVMGVSQNYFVMVQKQFKDTYYSVCSKLPWKGTAHNNMIGGHFHCGRDFWIFGDVDFDYNFDDQTAVAKYLQKFESGESEISERNGIPILEIKIKHTGGIK